MRLAGSMCYSCLNTLKRKLMQVYGVANIKIDKPVHNLFQPYAPDVSSWAEAVLIYDMNKVALADVRSYMRSNGYMSYKVVDKTFSDSLDTLKEQK
jgi:copper chaperone CopZ